MEISEMTTEMGAQYGPGITGTAESFTVEGIPYNDETKGN
jgi:hypothetical protein